MHAECASDEEHRRSIRPHTKATSDIRASKGRTSVSDVTDISRQGGQTEWKWDYKQVVQGENDRQKDVSRRKHLTEQRQQVRIGCANTTYRLLICIARPAHRSLYDCDTAVDGRGFVGQRANEGPNDSNLRTTSAILRARCRHKRRHSVPSPGKHYRQWSVRFSCLSFTTSYSFMTGLVMVCLSSFLRSISC